MAWWLCRYRLQSFGVWLRKPQQNENKAFCLLFRHLNYNWHQVQHNMLCKARCWILYLREFKKSWIKVYQVSLLQGFSESLVCLIYNLNLQDNDIICRVSKSIWPTKTFCFKICPKTSICSQIYEFPSVSKSFILLLHIICITFNFSSETQLNKVQRV